MTPPGLAYVQPYAGATTCVVIGPAGTGLIPDADRFRAVLWFVDADSIAHPPAGLAHGALETAPIEQLDSARIAAVLDRFVQHDARHLPSVFFTEDARARHIEAYESVLTNTCANLERHHRARVSRQRDGFAWQKNALQNLPSYVGFRLPASWRGALRGLPALVCGAGPSLDVSAPQLAAHAANGIVLAADSALRTLARHGVTADVAVTIDAGKTPDKCLPEDRMPERLVLSIVSAPAWRSAVTPDRFCYAANRQITTAWLADVGVAWPAVTVSEQWGGTALELARYLGCSPIYLFGMDLALDPGTPGRLHAADVEPTLYDPSALDPKRRFPEVPGNYGAAVPSHLAADWQFLDARLSGWPFGLLYNVTDRGAWLSNTTLVHPDNFTLRPATVDKAAAVAALGSPEPAPALVVDSAFEQIREIGRRHSAGVAGLRAELAKGGPPAAAAAFSLLFAEQTLGRVLGTFSLKLMPHLMPPLEGDNAFWNTLIDEYAELLSLAQNVRM